MKNMIFLMLGIVLGVYLHSAGILTPDTIESAFHWLKAKTELALNSEG